MITNYVLIDFENVQPKNLDLLKEAGFRVLVFIGANQAKIPIEFAKSMQALGVAGQYIQIEGNGKNALDFHIAYTIGELVGSDPDGYFHVISKDTGFDPLIGFLKKRKIRILRSRDIADIPLLRSASTLTQDEKLKEIIRNLESRGSGRPRKTNTLKNTINALFNKSLDDSELSSLLKELVRQGKISIVKENISYHLTDALSQTN